MSYSGASETLEHMCAAISEVNECNAEVQEMGTWLAEKLRLTFWKQVKRIVSLGVEKLSQHFTTSDKYEFHLRMSGEICISFHSRSTRGVKSSGWVGK